MSKFTDKLKEKIRGLSGLVSTEFIEEGCQDIISFVECSQGEDLEDLMADFDKEDQMDYFRDIKAAGVTWIECSDINAEADLKELLEEFKQKHIMTKIVL